MGYYDKDNAVNRLIRECQRLADKHGASYQDLEDDEALLIMLLQGDREDADAYVRQTWAYCEEHDEQHGDCEVN